MARANELIGLEHEGWKALSQGGEAAATFYDRVLATNVLMILPGGMVIADRADAIDSMSGAPWDGFELLDEAVFVLDEDCAVVTYRAHASRGGDRYEALFNSTYVREGGEWKLALHQQTPV